MCQLPSRLAQETVSCDDVEAAFRLPLAARYVGHRETSVVEV
jgi:hypothetical protein